MKLYTAAQMRTADALAAEAGVPTARLMHAAGTAVAGAVRQWYPEGRRTIVLCGSGNSGDGYVAAETLAEQGMDVSVFELPAAAEHKPAGTEVLPDAVAARLSCIAAGISPLLLNEGSASSIANLIATTPDGVVIDALFGSGLNRPLAGWLAEFVVNLNSAGAPVIAVDVPSGLSADLAEPIGPHVHADLTVELAGYKPASLFYPARHAYGRRVLADIGIPTQVLNQTSNTEILSASQLAPYLPHIDPAGHKYDAGTVCIVAGSEPYLGAAELACRGAWRGGAGLVTLVAHRQFEAAWPETIFERHEWALTAAGGVLPHTSEAEVEGARPDTVNAWPPVNLTPRRAASMVIGPGLEHTVLRHLPAMIEWAPGPVVLDAAALNPEAFSSAAEQIARAPTVITPHAGEAQLLLNRLADQGSQCAKQGLVAGDPLTAAACLAKATGAVTALKGPTTVICEPSGRTAVSVRGAPELATGGTGDVLAGLLGALLARPGGKEALFERTCLAVWLHGVAGELAAARLGRSLVATDVAEHLPQAYSQLNRPNP